VIPIRSRPVIAANCIGKALDQGVQEKALQPLAERRFPPPWSIEELESCFVVTDNAGAPQRQRSFSVPATQRSSIIPKQYVSRRIDPARRFPPPFVLHCGIDVAFQRSPQRRTIWVTAWEPREGGSLCQTI
jgi:hypothetical protein